MRKNKLLIVLASSLVALSLSAVPASAKSWHYSVTPSNSFSKKTFRKAYMYGHYEYMELYKTATNAQKQSSDTGKVISGYKSLTARKTANKKVYEVIYNKTHYFMNTNDTKLYRYNAWRKGNKIISTIKPSQTKKAMLKAKTHVYKSQYWLYNFSGKDTPTYTWYKLSKKGNWYIDYSK